MFHNKRYEELGITSKDWFTDEEFKNLPDISLLYNLYKDYKSQLNSKQSIENQITESQEKNANLPNNEDEILEKQNLLTQIDSEYDSETALNKMRLDELKDKTQNELDELIQQQEPTDLQPLNDDLTSQEQDLTSKKNEVNEESNRLGLGDLV